MSLSVVDKYVAKKEKDLLEYAKILESILFIDENKMWESKKEFVDYTKDIIGIYADAYYFQNNIHRDNPIEYSNDNINYVAKAIIEYWKNNDGLAKIRMWKKEIFLMSVIICTASYLDFACNVVDGDYKDTKNKFKYLLEYLGKTNIIKVKDNKYFINDLFEAIKKNMGEDEKVINGLVSDNYFNEYKKVSPSVYEVKFKYMIDGLKDIDEKLTKQVLKKYDSKFRELSVNLLEMEILKSLISNRRMNTYLIDIDKALKKSSIMKILSSRYMHDYVKIKVKFDEEVTYRELINEYKRLDVNIIYDVSTKEHIEVKTFAKDMELLVYKEFIDNNKDNELSFTNMNIKLLVKNKEDEEE